MKNCPRHPVTTKDGLRIDFRTENGEPLGYIRFEFNGKYIGAIDRNEREKLFKIKKAIDYLVTEEG